MTDYGLLASQVKEMLRTEPWYTAALSNISALLMDSISDINWVGFYLLKQNRLVVGPFQGHPACIHIEIGKGVCGTAVAENRIQLVPDVHLFPGHIACDSASRSEIVLPIHFKGQVAAVLDIDSPIKNRFSSEDAEGLSHIVASIEDMIVWEA